ncbi:MAG: nucleoside triphosphate pyrophosphohydrolase [Clostridiales bacterium]|nr:nucleoside triphosphate pyrophosphohydrolase [Clostridiales bacterium]
MNQDFEFREKYEMNDLLRIMRLLRSPEGCPWDREQTHQSIRKNFIEETYEVVEAIDAEDPVLLQEELGDVLLQVVFHARMEEEAGRFGFSEVVDGICKKLIERHPHIFADVQVDGTGEVLKNWETIKQEKKGLKKQSDAMDTVPRVLPALMRSTKVQQKAAKAGFDWPDVTGALDKLEEEIRELREAVQSGDAVHCKEELGDVLFSAVNVSRFVGADAEESLTSACDKFVARYKLVELEAQEKGLSMEQMSIEELDALWNRAKEKLSADSSESEK